MKRTRIAACLAACVLASVSLGQGAGTAYAQEGYAIVYAADSQENGVLPGHSIQVTVNGITGSISWGISGNTSSATTITQDGYLTVGLDEQAEAITVIAMSREDPSQTVMTKIKIAKRTEPDPEPEPPTQAAEITSVSLSGGGSVDVGSQIRLVAKVNGTGDYDGSVSWSISGQKNRNTHIAEGVLYVDAAETASVITVVATANGNSRISSSTKVTVIPAPVPDPVISGVSLRGASAIKTGQSSQFTATVSGSHAYDRTVSWSISGSDGASSISSRGMLTVSSNETADSITVIATANGDGSKKAEKIVKITKPVKREEPEKPSVNHNKQHTSSKTDYISGTQEIISGTGKITQTITKIPAIKNDGSASAMKRPTGGTTAATVSMAAEQAITKKVANEIDGTIANMTALIRANAEKKQEEALNDTDQSSNVSKNQQVKTSDNQILLYAGITFAAAAFLIIVFLIIKKNLRKKGKKD